MTNQTNETARQNKAPSHILWFAPERENAPWTRIGAQWPTKDGTGFRIALDMVPIARGSVVALPFEQRAEDTEAGAQ